MTVANSAFTANSAKLGGGISNYMELGNFGGTLEVNNSTFSANAAPSGSGLFNYGVVTMTNATFSGSEGGGAGIFNGAGTHGTTLTLNNTIVANSTAVNCLNNGLLIDGGGNLSWPDASCPGLNAGPLLGPLQDNGGPTPTQALLAGSPALDTALLANCPATDPRGVSRPQGPGCDIGAYELGVESIPPTIGINIPADGAICVLGQAVTADYACQDEVGGSGIASCTGTVPNGSPIDTSSVGAKRFTVDASDNAGNLASLAHPYRVIYDFNGFFEPVDNLPTMNVVKAGVRLPVRFSLGGEQGLDIFAAGYPASPKIPCTRGAPHDAIEEAVTVGSRSLSYDSALDTYTLTLLVAICSGGCDECRGKQPRPGPADTGNGRNRSNGRPAVAAAVDCRRPGRQPCCRVPRLRRLSPTPGREDPPHPAGRPGAVGCVPGASRRRRRATGRGRSMGIGKLGRRSRERLRRVGQ